MKTLKLNYNEKQLKHFEANMLDGDNINNCGGAMLSAKSVWEYIDENILKAELKLNYKQMCLDINELVDNEFVMDMERIALEKPNPGFSQDDAKVMAKTLTDIYKISHATYCTACSGKYGIRKTK